MRGILVERWRELDGDGSHAKNIAVPINQCAWWRGLDLNFLRLGLRALDLWLGLLRGGTGAEEQALRSRGALTKRMARNRIFIIPMW